MNEIIYAGKHLITFSVSTHAHTNWEFIYCTSGEGQLIYNEKCLPYKEGDLLLIPPMVYHRNESSTGFTNIHFNMANPAITPSTTSIWRWSGASLSSLSAPPAAENPRRCA